MRRVFMGVALMLGLVGSTGALAAPGLPGVKAPKAPKTPDVPDAEVPSLPRMTVDGILNAVEDASRKLDKSGKTLFDAQMELLDAIGAADKALEYRARIEEIEAKPASDERDAEMRAVMTDEGITEALVEQLTDKQNEMDDERKKKARDATVHIMLARLMAAATSEDAATVSGASVDMSQRIAEGDTTLLEDIARKSTNPTAFVASVKGRAKRISETSKAYSAQSKAVKDVVDKYRKKRKLFDDISIEEPKQLLAQSNF